MKESDLKALAASMLRFRIMAIWAGVMSLLLWFVYLPIKYLMSDPSFHEKVIWIPLVHGYTYPIYVLAAFHFCLKAKKSFPATIAFILAGTMPIASFVAERRAVAQFDSLTK